LLLWRRSCPWLAMEVQLPQTIAETEKFGMPLAFKCF
jgi:hypothetical protein